MKKIKQKSPVSIKALYDNPMYKVAETDRHNTGNIVLYERVMRKRTITTKNNVMVVDSINSLRARNYCVLNIDNLINTRQKPSFVITTFGDKILNSQKTSLLNHNYDLINIDLTDPTNSIKINVFKEMFANYKKYAKKQPIIAQLYYKSILNIIDVMFDVQTLDDERRNGFVKAFVINMLQQQKTTASKFSIDNIYKTLKGYLAKISKLENLFVEPSKEVSTLAKQLLKCKEAKKKELVTEICDTLKLYLTPNIKKICSQNTLKLDMICEIPTCLIIKMDPDNTKENIYTPLIMEYVFNQLYVMHKLNGNNLSREINIMLDNATKMPRLYDLSFRVDQGRNMGIRYCMVVENFDEISSLYTYNYKKLIENFETKIFVESSRKSTKEKFATLVVEPEQKLGKYHLFAKKSKTYNFDLNGLKDGEGVIFEQNKTPVYTDFDFLS